MIVFTIYYDCLSDDLLVAVCFIFLTLLICLHPIILLNIQRFESVDIINEDDCASALGSRSSQKPIIILIHNSILRLIFGGIRQPFVSCS